MRAAIPDFATSTLFNQRATLSFWHAVELGRGGEIRTPDPHNPIVVRYQAALRPDRLQTKADGGNDTCHSMQKKVDFFSAAEA